MIGGPVLGSATHPEASWSRSNSSWGTFRFKRLNDILAVSSGFDQPSMIESASSRILELGVELWKGCRQSAHYSRSGGRHRAAINDVVCTMNRSCTIGC